MNRKAGLIVGFCMVVSTALTLGGQSAAQDHILLQSTTSTQNSGLYEHLLPLFEKQSGIQVRVVAVGTGQAIKNARNCDGDVLLVHAKAAELAFVEEGSGTVRHDLMYNDFVLVGPATDPAGIKGMMKIGAALEKIARARAAFVSRGDNSGTHKKETALWAATDVDPVGYSGTWYRETGSGMGATLNTASAMDAYALTDRATWISFGNKADHIVLIEGDPDLFNQYGVILVNKERCPNIKDRAGQQFIDWLLSPQGQGAIGRYRLNGEQLFYPNGS